MTKIIRTKTKAEGGITEEEKKKLDFHAKLWISRIMRTTPIDRDKIVPAIEKLYEVSGLKKPRVIIVPSPLVGRLASGLAASIWYLRKHGKSAATRDATRDATDVATFVATDVATDVATRVATRDATRDATREATDAATDAATRDATLAATRDATRDATDAATDAATYAATDKKSEWLYQLIKKLTPDSIKFSIGCISLSYGFYQGGNMWGQYDSYLTAIRDVLRLQLPIFEKYKAWEDCAIEGGFRYMHEEFCMVSDFPEKLEKDAQNRPHCETGPSHRWRDGFEIYHLHGVRFDKELYLKVISGSMPFEDILAIKDIDQRTQAMKYGDPDKFLSHAKAELLNETENGNRLYKIPKGEIFSEDAYFLRYQCPSTEKEYMKGVPPEIGQNKNADYAQAWSHNLTLNQYLGINVQS